ncbi:sulfatase family protein [Nonlabens ulvanivorans]|uniref:Arylsulfatase A-like enzyme n=1 Tax=Nonlabens ulvanivorans TaxID=906888 RepID=A0ABX5E318_NONUL|nr:sulfatase [Nonlabens ulvanivorans]PRX11946.1 arylsulfatase A-like enzyme [Nonlabens ulvanivorans]
MINRNIIIAFCLFSIVSCKNDPNNGNQEVSSNEGSKKPNIIYILTDQWRGSALGYAGNPDVKTPHLDELAQSSVNFTNAVSVTPVCTPHRAALLTGKFPTTTGMFLNDLYFPEEEVTMAELFKEQDYSTAYWGKWHLDGHGRTNFIPKERRQGFEYWKAVECSHNYTKMPYYDNDNTALKHWEEYSPFAIVNDANQYLTDHANDENPFIAVISIATPHYPHGSAPKKYKNMYPPETLTLNPNISEEFKERARKELQGYYAHATATDEAIGSLLSKIEELELTENTIVVFSSDHGEMMGAHGVKPFVKQLAWDEAARVPFLIRYPGIGQNKGKVVNAPLTTPDILPSLLGLANIEIPEDIEGENLSELIKNPDPNVDRAALIMNVAPFGSNFKDAPYRAIRTRQYTYAVTPDGPTMFYDNISDPLQQNNLLGKTELQEIQKDLDHKLQQQLQHIGDSVRPRDYYMKKWNYVFDKKRNAIDWWSWKEGTGTVQSPQ